MKTSKLLMWLICAGLLAAGAVYAQNYPTKPVRLIIPFAPGGAADFATRVILPGVSKELGQQVVVDYRAGASGNIGVEVVAHAPADGYTLLLGGIGPMAINPGVFPKLKISPVRDLVGVTLVADVPTCLAVHPSLPVKTVKEFIDYAKARPGKLNFGTGAATSNGRFQMESFMRQTGIQLMVVVYKGGAGDATIGVMGGEVQCAFISLPSSIPLHASGKLRIIAIPQPKRVAQLPDVPVFPEVGFPDINNGSWQGIYAPAGTPRPVLDRLFTAFTKILRDPEIIKRLNDFGAEVVTSKSPEEFAAFMKRENEKWGKVVKEAGVVME